MGRLRTISYVDPADADKPKSPAGDGLPRQAALAVRTGGQILVDQLEQNEVELAFCVPGESYLPVLDALLDSPIRLISARHEASAANMAEAYGKLTGRPGVCLVTRGPGATHASVGVHTAWQDSTPMLLLVGQVPRGHLGREAFQEMDFGALFGSTAWVGQADSAARPPELVSRAFSATLSGRPARPSSLFRRTCCSRSPTSRMPGGHGDATVTRGGRPRTRS